MGISAKFSPYQNVFLVTDLKTASPVANASVTVRGPNNQVYWTGTTNAEGIAESPGWYALGMNHSAPARIETLAEVEYFEAPSGTVWFGHRRGVVRVSPEGMKTPRSIPSVKLTEASVHAED